MTRSEEALRFCVRVYVYVFDLRDTTESVFQRRKVIQKHGDIPVNSMKGVRNSGSRSNVSKSADPKNRRHRGGGGRRRERKRMEEKVGEVKKKIKKLAKYHSHARSIPRIELQIPSCTSRKDPIVDRATTWLRVFPHRTKML